MTAGEEVEKLEPCGHYWEYIMAVTAKQREFTRKLRIPQSHSWVYTQKQWNQDLKVISALMFIAELCISIYKMLLNAQKMWHKHTMECQFLKRRKSCNMQHHE